MSAMQPHTIGGTAVADDGVVLLDGPDGVAVAMTPAAAEETAHQLLGAAKEAAAQPSAMDGR